MVAKQDAETHTDVDKYINKLRIYRVAQTHTECTLVAEIHDIEPATADELSRKVCEEDIPEEAADWDGIFEKSVPAKASIVTKEINGN